MFVMTKKIKKLFASTLTGITASVRCVSSMIVVLNAKLPQLIAAHANKKMMRNEEALVLNPNLHCARGKESIVYYPKIYAR